MHICIFLGEGVLDPEKIEDRWSMESQACPKLQNDMIRDVYYKCSINMSGHMDKWMDE